jgi:ABC-type multidrug transport system fused ATPase/permease subunit
MDNYKATFWKKETRHLINSILYIFVFILMCFLVLRAFYDISMVLAIIGVFITIYVALLQSPQLNKLTAIVRETKAITETLGTNAEKEKNVKSFFPRNNEENDKNKYKLFYPVDNEGKTLPLVN